MNNLTPTYRIKINQNLLNYPQFFEVLKHEYSHLITKGVKQGNYNLEEEYKFTLLSIPVQWGNKVIPKVRQVENLPEDKVDPKWKKISEILLSLDPINPQPVDVVFTLGEIITYTLNNIKVYQEVTPGGVKNYFGIETQSWFNDYPIQTGTVLRAVDMGTLDNKPKYLFNSAFSVLRKSLLDLFAVYMNNTEKGVFGINVNI